MAHRQQSDPSVYNEHHQIFASQGLPQDENAWLERATTVSKILAQDITSRDIEQKIPFAEVSLLKSSALTKILGPAEYGGGGQSWNVAYKVIREIAKGDG
jgi:alkylation response protein AidB-like acyl-CoA dehydrogenase